MVPNLGNKNTFLKYFSYFTYIFLNISCIFVTIKNILKIYFGGIFLVYFGHIFYILFFFFFFFYVFIDFQRLQNNVQQINPKYQDNQWLTVKIRKKRRKKKKKKKIAAAALLESRPQGVHKKYGPRDREDGQNTPETAPRTSRPNGRSTRPAPATVQGRFHYWMLWRGSVKFDPLIMKLKWAQIYRLKQKHTTTTKYSIQLGTVETRYKEIITYNKTPDATKQPLRSYQINFPCPVLSIDHRYITKHLTFWHNKWNFSIHMITLYRAPTVHVSPNSHTLLLCRNGTCLIAREARDGRNSRPPSKYTRRRRRVTTVIHPSPQGGAPPDRATTW